MFKGGFQIYVWTMVLIIFGLLIVNVQAGSYEINNFIKSRQVVCTILFEPGSKGLNDAGKAEIDKVVSQLSAVNQDDQVVRVEGFSSADGTEMTNLSLSMARAKNVEDYLREQHDLPMNRYLVGRGVSHEKGLSKAEQRRVEIAIYDNLLNIETSDVDRVDIDGKRGNK